VFPVLDQLEREHPDYAEIQVTRAAMLGREKKYTEALAAAQKGLSVAPYNQKLLTYSAQLWVGVKNAKNALEAAEKGLKSYPNNYSLGMIKLSALVALQRNDEAQAFAKVLKQRFPDNATEIQLLVPNLK
jgi:predicted Zn-dependent protease